MTAGAAPRFELFWPQVGLTGFFLSLDGFFFTDVYVCWQVPFLFLPSQFLAVSGALVCILYLASYFLSDKRKLRRRRQVAVNPRDVHIATEVCSVIGAMFALIIDAFIILYVWPI